jgi:hypothetical protein
LALWQIEKWQLVCLLVAVGRISDCIWVVNVENTASKS